MCTRDELQGVIAHELGHIRNRDTLLMLMAGVMVGAIVILSDIGLRSLWFTGGGRSRSRRRSGGSGGGQAQLIIFIVALVLMILGPIIAQLIYFAISRRREYLADASAASFTRYPEGLASALEKLGGAPRQVARATRATAPLYIVNPLKTGAQAAAGATSTHPPITERVRILRSMTGASFADYDAACSQVHGRPVLPASALKGSEPAAKRAAQKAEEKKQRARQVNDFLYEVSRYVFLTCACGTTLKLPPSFEAPRVKCPRCGREHGKDEFHPEAPKRDAS
jgi:heat shock protein HtpX